jgi:hypothetical protein
MNPSIMSPLVVACASLVSVNLRGKKDYFGSVVAESENLPPEGIALQMQIIQESLLRRERFDNKNSVQKFSRAGKDRRPRVT